jgi:hypothetical protein
MKKISLSIAFVYTFFVCKEEQQVATQDLQSLQSKITTEDATTYRDFTAIEGQQNVETDQK